MVSNCLVGLRDLLLVIQRFSDFQDGQDVLFYPNKWEGNYLVITHHRVVALRQFAPFDVQALTNAKFFHLTDLNCGKCVPTLHKSKPKMGIILLVQTVGSFDE